MVFKGVARQLHRPSELSFSKVRRLQQHVLPGLLQARTTYTSRSGSGALAAEPSAPLEGKRKKLEGNDRLFADALWKQPSGTSVTSGLTEMLWRTSEQFGADKHL